MSASLSVLIFTLNEERNIATCLDSVVGWAADIVVVDSGSTDRTLALCAERGVQTVVHTFTDHASQRRWAVTSLPWKYDWFLLLDADHIVTTELKQEIDRMLRDDDGTIHGFYNPHVQYFRNRRVRGQKSRYLQLVRRGHVYFDDSELVDLRLIVDGPTGTMSGAILERNQNEVDIDFWIDKQQKYARRMAIQEVLRAEQLLGGADALQPRLLGNPDERLIWFKDLWYGLPLYVRPVLYFSYRYFLRLGFADGWNGFVFHAFHAFWFRLLVDVHIADYRSRLKQNVISLQDLLEVAGGGGGGHHG